MAQYYPAYKAVGHPELARPVTEEEYGRVVEEMERLGLDRGWIQEFESRDHYRPDFGLDHPFELPDDRARPS
jgi:hypothetical protein